MYMIDRNLYMAIHLQGAETTYCPHINQFIFFPPKTVLSLSNHIMYDLNKVVLPFNLSEPH
jgi:hypothetical protein